MSESWKEWIEEGDRLYKEATTLSSEKGQELYNRAWLKYSMMPQTVADWNKLFEEINIFIADPKNPEEDKEKIKGILEGAYLTYSACKGMEEKARRKEKEDEMEKKKCNRKIKRIY